MAEQATGEDEEPDLNPARTEGAGREEPSVTPAASDRQYSHHVLKMPNLQKIANKKTEFQSALALLGSFVNYCYFFGAIPFRMTIEGNDNNEMRLHVTTKRHKLVQSYLGVFAGFVGVLVFAVGAIRAMAITGLRFENPIDMVRIILALVLILLFIVQFDVVIGATRVDERIHILRMIVNCLEEYQVRNKYQLKFPSKVCEAFLVGFMCGELPTVVAICIYYCEFIIGGAGLTTVCPTQNGNPSTVWIWREHPILASLSLALILTYMIHQLLSGAVYYLVTAVMYSPAVLKIMERHSYQERVSRADNQTNELGSSSEWLKEQKHLEVLFTLINEFAEPTVPPVLAVGMVIILLALYAGITLHESLLASMLFGIIGVTYVAFAGLIMKKISDMYELSNQHLENAKRHTNHSQKHWQLNLKACRPCAISVGSYCRRYTKSSNVDCWLKMEETLVDMVLAV